MRRRLVNDPRLKTVARHLIELTLGQDWLRRRGEHLHFSRLEEVHDLPPIFHYWSNKYLRPWYEPHGFSDPDGFFAKYCQRQIEGANHTVRIASLGAGNGDYELRLAQELISRGCEAFEIHALEINRDMIARGTTAIAQAGLAERVKMTRADLNKWAPEVEYDVVVANQFLHHVVELEHLFDAVHRCLKRDGVFLISDMIGRNGHRRWPEARRLLKPFWRELPESYRYNRALRRLELEYQDHDCAATSFEGVRAQDILPLLHQRFDFELFIPFANNVLVFVDRSFGSNFDADASWDRDFIDRVHESDERGFRSGELKPTQMTAVVRKHWQDRPILRQPYLTPDSCIRAVKP